jgi:hypothetical protein
MGRKGYSCVDDVRGLLAVPAGPDRAGYQRASYVRTMRAADEVAQATLEPATEWSSG